MVGISTIRNIMPAKSRNQQIAAIIAEKVKNGTAKSVPGAPSSKMAKMPMKSLSDFAKANITKKKKKGKKNAIFSDTY
jgi:hypothetical protein